MSEEETILLVDLGSLIYPYWGATTSQFQTFTKTIHRIEMMAENYKATIVCADSARNWRHDIEPSYKAHREKKAPEFVTTLQDVKERLIDLEFPLVECDTYEADDVIATLVSQSYDPIHVLSEDKDLVQLVSDGVSQLTKYGTITPAVCWRKWGVKPEQMRDFLTLWGDVSDNVTGCPGVGQVAAAKLLERFGSLKAIRETSPVVLQTIRGIGPSTVKSLTEWDPEPAHTLVSLKTDAPASLQEQLRRCGVAA